jgi:AcrR family transcriptional regulator
MAGPSRPRDAAAPAPASARERLLDTALTLFERDGFHATGIDRVLAESGVAKMSLYKHFGSKDALAAAALRHRSAALLARLDAAREAAPDPRDRLLSIFGVLDAWFGEHSFRGCPFVHAAGEYGDRAPLLAAAVRDHKQAIHDRLAEAAGRAGCTDPGAIAIELHLLVEGAITLANLQGRPGLAGAARRAAERLIGPAPCSAAAGGSARATPAEPR